MTSNHSSVFQASQPVVLSVEVVSRRGIEVKVNGDLTLPLVTSVLEPDLHLSLSEPE